MQYQQLPRRHVWNGEQPNNHMHDDSDEDVDHYEEISARSRNPGSMDAENGGPRVHDIQRLERALRVVGMA